MPKSDSTSLDIEKTRVVLPELYERNDTLWALMKRRMDVEKVGVRAMRLPFKIQPAGKFRQVDFDGGDLGRGNNAKFANGTIAPIDFAVAVESTKKMEYATDSREKSVLKVTMNDVNDAMWTLRTMIDVLLQTPGTGQIGVMSSGAGTTTWTLGGNFKAGLILEGQTVNNYDSTFATKRVGDSVVQTVDEENGIITVDAAPAGHTNTDLIVIEGLSGANPVSLYGIPYHHSDATSGTWLGLNRATTPGIRTPAVNANNATLTPAHVRLALNKSRLRLGVDSNPGEFIAYMHVAQQAVYEDIGQSQMLVLKEANANQGFDPFYAVKTIAGVPIKAAKHADRTRIDFLRLSDWGRAEMLAPDYVTWGPGNRIIPIYGTSGGAKAAQVWYVGTSFQIFNQNPRAGAYIYSLAIPTGY